MLFPISMYSPWDRVVARVDCYEEAETRLWDGPKVIIRRDVLKASLGDGCRWPNLAWVQRGGCLIAGAEPGHIWPRQLSQPTLLFIYRKDPAPANGRRAAALPNFLLTSPHHWQDLRYPVLYFFSFRISTNICIQLFIAEVYRV